VGDVRNGETSADGADLDVEVRLDAIKVAASDFDKGKFRELEDYRLAYDYRLNGDPAKRLYDRARSYENTRMGMKVGVAYDPAHAWMPGCLVTMTPNDRTGMRRYELEELLAQLPNYRFLKIEVAHDFRVGSVVDAAFARKHLMIGKSRRNSEAGTAMLHFGARRSPVFARCYWKRPIKRYRVEIEYHRPWLAKNGIKTTDDFSRLPDLTARHHIAFYRINPLKLSSCLARLDVPVAPALREVIAREDDLHVALHYLRHDLGVVNALRVLAPLKTNIRVERALREWAQDWMGQEKYLSEVAGDE
jgi:hypothetical protein